MATEKSLPISMEVLLLGKNFLLWSSLIISIILAICYIVIAHSVDSIRPQANTEAIQKTILTKIQKEPIPTKFLFNTQFSTKNLTCLADAIFHEAGIDSLLGKEAVAIVILNRAAKKETTDICSIVSESRIIGGRKVCQFSYYCNSNRRIPQDGILWADSMLVAVLALHNRFDDRVVSLVGKAEFYHADYIKQPIWAQKMEFLGKIDTHYFYREKAKENANNQ